MKTFEQIQLRNYYESFYVPQVTVKLQRTIKIDIESNFGTGNEIEIIGKDIFEVNMFTYLPIFVNIWNLIL